MIVKSVSAKVADLINNEIIRIGSLLYYKEIEDSKRNDSLEGIPDKVLTRPVGGKITSEEFNKVSDEVSSVIRVKKPINLQFITSINITKNSAIDKYLNQNSKFKYREGKLVAEGIVSDDESEMLKSIVDKSDIFNVDELQRKSKLTGRMKFNSDFNTHVFCTFKYDSNSMIENQKFGNKIFIIKNVDVFSRIISNELFRLYNKQKLTTNGTYNTMCRAYQDVSYDDNKSKMSFVSRDESGVTILNSMAVFIKPLKFKPENEFRFLWNPCNSSDKSMANLSFGHRYIDIKAKGLLKIIEWIK
jgi:hypothetical protein